MKTGRTRILKTRIVSSLFSLYGLQFATLVLPLVLLPFLARRLGPEMWGLLAMFTSLSGILSIVLEFGFGFGATRSVAKNRSNPSRVADVVSDVLGARVILTLIVTGAWIAVWFLVPVVRGAGAAYWWTLALTVAQGASFAWYFQAVGRLPFVAIRDIVARVVSTVLILIWVQGPEDIGKVPAIQFATAFVAFSLGVHEMYRTVGWRAPKVSRSVRILRSNGYLSGLRILQSLTSMGNTFLVGAISPMALSIYGASERTSNAARSMVTPITQVAFPEFVAVAGQDRVRARMLLRRVCLALVAGGVVGAGLIWLLAGLIVLVLFGNQFSGAVEVFRILGLTLPFFAISQVIGSQWMLAVGHDKAFFVAVASGFVVNVGFALIWIPPYGAVGMAWAFAISEGIVATTILVFVEFFAPPEARIFRQVVREPLPNNRKLVVG